MGDLRNQKERSAPATTFEEIMTDCEGKHTTKVDQLINAIKGDAPHQDHITAGDVGRSTQHIDKSRPPQTQDVVVTPPGSNRDDYYPLYIGIFTRRHPHADQA